MARSRNIKPGFFRNEDLAECSPWARLCFVGLWLLADREGRLVDRPKRIKAELFAYDSVEVAPLLDELQAHGFILRYVVPDGVRVIQILQFRKHQAPHFKEPKSELPSPESLGLLVDATTVEPRKAEALPALNDSKARESTGLSPPNDDSKASDKPGASTGQAPDKPEAGSVQGQGSPPVERGSNRADSRFLIPDSLIPDSLEGAHRTSPPKSRAGTLCRALKQAGIPGVSPSHPRLVALLAAGATDEEFLDAAPKAVGKGDGFAYVLGVVEGRRRDAAQARNGMHNGPMPRAETPLQRESRERVEAAVPNLAPQRHDDAAAHRSPPPPTEVIDVVAKRLG